MEKTSQMRKGGAERERKTHNREGGNSVVDVHHIDAKYPGIRGERERLALVNGSDVQLEEEETIVRETEEWGRVCT